MKRILRTFLLSILVVLAFGTVAQAKEVRNYKAIATKQNTWYKLKEYDYKYDYSGNESIYTYTYNRYKVTVPANYYMVLSLKKGSDIRIYKSLKADYSKHIKYFYSDKNSSYNIVLPKGIYYFSGTWGDQVYGAFKYKFVKYVNKPNYKGTKALSWGANKKLAIVQTPGHNYERWYKVKLAKKKRIYVYGTDSYNGVALYNAKHQRLRGTSNSNSDGYIYSSYNSLKPGTYYIRIFGDRDEGLDEDTYPWFGSVSIVWWK